MKARTWAMVAMGMASVAVLSAGCASDEVPEAPRTISAAAQDKAVEVRWGLVGAASSYNIYWNTTAGVTELTGNLLEGVSTPYDHTGLTNGTTYYYIVTANSKAGESDPTAEVSATPRPPRPNRPTGVSAKGGNTKTTIAWDTVTGATGYNLYWATSSGVSKAGGTRVASPSRPYSHTGLTNGTTYYYVVTAANSGGESLESIEARATPQIPSPDIPTGLAVTAGDATTTLTWEEVETATSYHLYHATAAGVTKANGAKLEDVTSPYDHSSLSNDTTYYYVATAENAGGESQVSDEVSATPKLPAVTPPQSFTVVAGDGELILSWDDVDSAASYALYWGTTASVSRTTGTKISDATSPHSHVGLTNGTAYFYVVTATNTHGESAGSTVIGATPDDSATGVPGGMNVSAGDAENIIGWDAVSGASSYNLYWKTSAGVTKANGTKIAGVTSPYTHDELTNGTGYYYVVTAVVSSSEGSISTEVAGEPNPIAPAAPLGLTLEVGFEQITLTWEDVAGADSYNAYFAEEEDVTIAGGTALTGITSRHTHTGLTTGTEYFYVVTAVRDSQESAESPEISAVASVPAPEGLDLLVGYDAIQVSWDEVTGADSYNIYWDVSSGVTKAEGEQIENVTNPYSLSGLATGFTYFVVVTAVNSGGESVISEEVSRKAPAYSDDLQRLVSPDPDDHDYFGQSVAVDGNTLIVGAAGEDPGDEGDAGAAFVYSRDPDTGEWSLEATLTASDAKAGVGLLPDQFGHDVDVSGDLAIIGAPGADIDGRDDQGAAYIFVRDSSTNEWSQEAKLTNTSDFNAAARDHFGWAVAISGSRAIVGAIGVAIGGNDNRGSIYIFHRDDNNDWTRAYRKDPSSFPIPAQMGYAVDIDGNFAISGSPGDNAAGTLAGAARTFEYDEGTATWSQTAKINNPFANAAGGRFGSAVSISGNFAVVGAIFADPNTGSAVVTDGGGAYVLHHDGSAWSASTALFPSTVATGDLFGYSIDLRGDRVVVGAPGADIGSRTDAGAAWAFHYDSEDETWQQGNKLISPDSAAGEEMGRAVAADARTGVLAGMLANPEIDDTTYTAGGAVFLFE